MVEKMSFYRDNDDFNQSRKRARRTNFSLLNSIISAIIGGLVVLLLLPAFISSGFIEITPNIEPPTSEQAEQGQKNNGQVSSTPNQQINIDVRSGIVEAADKVKPAVIGVVNIQEQSSIWSRTTRTVEAGVGSGVVFDKKDGTAYIVTNYHVIANAKDIEVALADGTRIPAKVLGADQLTDLAVISVNSDAVDRVAEFGDSTNLKPGEPAIAIGNPLGLEFSQTITVGVVSSGNRSIPQDLDGDGQADWETEVIQTDAAINPGNSGGALVNINGEVIGINSSKISKSGVEGLGFAIPISDAKPIIEQLIKDGKVKRPYMGISPVDLSQVSAQERRDVLKLPNTVTDGIVLIEVSRFGPASIAGLKRLDVIVKLDQVDIKSSSDLRKFLYKEKKVGEKTKVTYYREGRLMTSELTLTDFPTNEQ